MKISAWWIEKRLILYIKKTEIVLFGNKKHLFKSGGSTISDCQAVECFGVFKKWNRKFELHARFVFKKRFSHSSVILLIRSILQRCVLLGDSKVYIKQIVQNGLLINESTSANNITRRWLFHKKATRLTDLKNRFFSSIGFFAVKKCSEWLCSLYTRSYQVQFQVA